MKSSVTPPRRNRLERRYGFGHLHFITCSCYRRLPLLDSRHARNTFLKILSEVRNRCDFGLYGFVVMPEHIHLLISEPRAGNPSAAMKVLKQRVSCVLRRRGRPTSAAQMRFWDESAGKRPARFWQRRFYDFNVWSTHKKNEKLNYMHFNPVKRGLARAPGDWIWSSWRFYAKRERGLCDPNPEWEHAQTRRRTFRNQNVRHPDR